jgi:glycosyltransferase involved in cell wall biosynthesis
MEGEPSQMTTAITLTGDRPKAFELCQKWMSRQITKPDQWIVVDDGSEKLNCIENIQYIKRERQPNEPKFTLILNLQEAIKYIIGDKIIFFEDDDYYAPEYITKMSAMLNDYDIVGIGRAKYYHLFGKYYMHSNLEHASLAQTAIRNNLTPLLKKALPGDCFIDLRLWKSIPATYKKNIFIDYQYLYCGIKGMPGRAGIGAGHNIEFNRYQSDTDRRVLKQWIPEDYTTYLNIAREMKYA